MGVKTEKKKVTKRATRTKTTQANKNTTSSLQNRIAEKAYELYTRRGCVDGYDILDWTLAQDLIELENKAASSKKLSRTSVKSEDLKEGIEKRAYELFEYRGCRDGNDLFDWSLAEEITSLRNNIR